MVNNVIIYTKENCPSCVKSKQLLNMKNIPYFETVVGQGILREDFMAIFPDVKSVPLIIIDEKRIGGYEQLREYFDNQPQFLRD